MAAAGGVCCSGEKASRSRDNKEKRKTSNINNKRLRKRLAAGVETGPKPEVTSFEKRLGGVIRGGA